MNEGENKVKKIKFMLFIGICTMACNVNVYATEKTEALNKEEKSYNVEEYDAENENNANSWRYKNGKLIETNVENRTRSARAYKEYSTWPSVNGMVAKGVDVCKWNGNIKWDKAKESGVDYAIIQCGYGQDDNSQDDPMWKINADACTKEGVPFGAYIYSYATNTTRAKSEAEHVLRLVKGYKLSYPVYYDLEQSSVRSTLSKSEIANVAQTFCDTIKKAGYEVGIYANTDWFTNYLTDSRFDQWGKWVAQYNSTCQYKGEYAMWQCSSKGSVDGIDGYVDLNIDLGVGSKNEVRLVEKEGEYYCYKGNTQMYGEQRIDNAWYYFDKDNGKMRIGFVNLGNKIVYYGVDGKMQYGEQKVNNAWYYFDKVTGAMWTGLVNLENKTAYYGTDGIMKYGEQRINNGWYYFDEESGAMRTGFVNLKNKTVYYGTDGIMKYGEQRINNGWYYFDRITGAMRTGFVNLGNKTVYYGTDGIMKYGEQRINNGWYYFDRVTGAMRTGFVNLENKTVYYGTDGIMKYGEQRINNGWYYFDKVTGAMRTGFVNLGNKVVYYNEDGKMLYGKQCVNSDYYYFNIKTGAMTKNAWINGEYYGIDGKKGV